MNLPGGELTWWAKRVAEADQAIAGVVNSTPMDYSRQLTQSSGGKVYLKCENLQRTGSYKIRGAYNRIRLLSDAERAGGVVAASAGNHAQGVALASSLLGASAKVYMPQGASITKVNATCGYGAEVVLTGGQVGDALAAAQADAADHGAVYIHPFDHVDVVAGQATLGLDILRQCPDVGTIVVPTGGGGLLAGMCVAAALADHRVDVVGVQAAGAAAYPVSLATGSVQTISQISTMADGIAVATPGQVPFGIIRELVSEVATVSEAEISRALLWLLERAKMLVEPSGATSVAALGQLADRVRYPVVAVLSGGNIDPQLLMRVIRHGLNGAGRYLRLTVSLADEPGALQRLLEVLARLGANVLQVGHARRGPTVGMNSAEVTTELETRGSSHCTEVLAGLVEAGFEVRPG